MEAQTKQLSGWQICVNSGQKYSRPSLSIKTLAKPKPFARACSTPPLPVQISSATGTRTLQRHWTLSKTSYGSQIDLMTCLSFLAHVECFLVIALKGHFSAAVSRKFARLLHIRLCKFALETPNVVQSCFAIHTHSSSASEANSLRGGFLILNCFHVCQNKSVPNLTPSLSCHWLNGRKSQVPKFPQKQSSKQE